MTRHRRVDLIHALLRLPRAAVRLLALSLALLAGHAMAATCSVSTPGVAFGGYDVFAAGATTSSGSIKVSCSTTGELFVQVNYAVTLSTGSSNSFVQRTMKNGADSLGYNLYTSNAYSTVWGDGTGSTATETGSFTLWFFSPTGTATLTVYGRVPALQDVSVGNYSDNVTATINW